MSGTGGITTTAATTGAMAATAAETPATGAPMTTVGKSATGGPEVVTTGTMAVMNPCGRNNRIEKESIERCSFASGSCCQGSENDSVAVLILGQCILDRRDAFSICLLGWRRRRRHFRQKLRCEHDGDANDATRPIMSQKKVIAERIRQSKSRGVPLVVRDFGAQQ